MTNNVSLDDQIAEVGREIGMRRAVYPGFIARGKYTRAEADDHMRKMEAVYATLKQLKASLEAGA